MRLRTWTLWVAGLLTLAGCGSESKDGGGGGSTDDFAIEPAGDGYRMTLKKSVLGQPFLLAPAIAKQ